MNRLALVCSIAALLAACHPFEDTRDFPFADADDASGTDDSQTSDTALGTVDSSSLETSMPDGADTSLPSADATELPLPGECVDPADCTRIYGAAPCGAWQCDASATCLLACGNCVDLDNDGYGVGSDCLAADCDDDDSSVLDNNVRSCYGGPPTTENVGACRSGLERCVDGAILPCVGSIEPSAEACNGEDDDCDRQIDEDLGMLTCGIGSCQTSVEACIAGGLLRQCTPNTAGVLTDSTCDGVDEDCDGAIDEDCLPSCVWVTPQGDDNRADGTLARPFRTIQPAIALAATNTAGGFSRQVCVSSGASCGQFFKYTPTADIVMAEGISVYGSYEHSNGTRCNQITTKVALGGHNGVIFKDIDAITVLDGFELERDRRGTSATGVSLNNAKQVLLSNLRIADRPQLQQSYGIFAIAGSEFHLTRSAIIGGHSSLESVGVKVQDSRVRITDSCPSYDSKGRCDQWCDWNNHASLGIRGVQTGNGLNRTSGKSAAVWLINAPGSVIERNTLCSGGTDDVIGLEIEGEADNVVVRNNHIAASAGTNYTYTVYSPSCQGDAPWLVDNSNIIAETGANLGPGHAIHIDGDCHPVIDSNLEITGAGEGPDAPEVFGIYCGSKGAPSRCTILGNSRIVGGKQWGPTCCIPLVASGIRCTDGACARIANNALITGEAGLTSIGIQLAVTDTVISNNVIEGGCLGTTRSVGIEANESYARLENNHISGGACATGVDATGLHVYENRQGAEMDVHSNVIDGGGAGGSSCSSVGLRLESNPNMTLQRGIYRNNIILTQSCTRAMRDVVENIDEATPRIFENNNLVYAPVLYKDGIAGNLAQIADVNNLLDAQIVNNLSVPPLFIRYPSDIHIDPASQCVNAGTAIGAPAVDMDGQPRDGTPDIGADEN